MSLIGCAINLKVKHWGSLNSTPLQCSMALSWTRDSGKSGMGMGVAVVDPRAGDRGSIPDPRQIGDGDGDGDRGFRALGLPVPLPAGGGSIFTKPEVSSVTVVLS